MPETKKRQAQRTAKKNDAIDEKRSAIADINVNAMPSFIDSNKTTIATSIMFPDTPLKGQCLAIISRYSPFAGKYSIERMSRPEILEGMGKIIDQTTGMEYDVPNAIILSTYKNSVKFTSERLHHAVKRMKEKGLYATNLFEMTRIALAKGLEPVIEMIQLLYTQAETFVTVCDQDSGVEFTERDYMAAIDMCMLLGNRDVFISNDRYANLIQENLAKIYYCVLSNHYIVTLNKTLQNQADEIDRIQKGTEPFGGLKKVLEDVQAELENGDKSAQEAIQKITDQFTEREGKLNADLESARARANAAENANAPLHKRLDDAEARAKHLEAELAKARDRARSAEAEAKRLSKELESARTELRRHTLPVLPASRVSFIGGAPNLVKKLSQIYPDWTYIDDDASDAFTVGSADLIFCYTAHISHKRSNRIEEIARHTGTPIAELPDIVNIRKLDLAMREAYAKILEQTSPEPN